MTGVCATAQVSCLVEQYLGAHDLPLEAFKVMRALAKVNRMKTTLLSMTAAEKGQLTALFDQLENTGVDWKSAGARPSPPLGSRTRLHAAHDSLRWPG